MLSKKKEKFEPLGEVDVSKLQLLVDIDSVEELKTKRETYEIILKMKEREKKYYKYFVIVYNESDSNWNSSLFGNRKNCINS